MSNTEVGGLLRRKTSEGAQELLERAPLAVARRQARGIAAPVDGELRIIHWPDRDTPEIPSHWIPLVQVESPALAAFARWNAVRDPAGKLLDRG